MPNRNPAIDLYRIVLMFGIGIAQKIKDRT